MRYNEITFFRLPKMDTSERQKPYEIEFDARGDYLYVCVTGEHDDFEISFAYWSEVGAKLRELGLKRVLIVEDIAEQSSMADVYHLVTRLGEIGFRGVSVAFVDRYLEHAELNGFGELAGTNAGMRGRAFHDEAEAEAWLISLT